MIAPAQHLSLFQMHPFVLVGVWWVCSAAIGALNAPTAQSSQFYQWFFKFSNTLAANVMRAYSTKVENSPNFLPAVDLHVSQNPQEPAK